ncbi:hypothetical protein COC60_06375 [Bacillus thuringiensis]|uniref:Integrase catalytic domain-containing protein n=1 Tax=Bacillus thuringiensis TaxID=1428 RepID=A0ABD6SNH1_BACTU|nr:DDE-type integrase/transposase/recombinase [Bacillus thuringiensis]PEU95081.1 hypothetical protein CN409_20175 [Bacillus sp. AFS012607]PEV57421.1 hypothetical protein CN422_18000 [Bacillus cereus]PEF29412.1 hypothetical protein CON39_16540 [Bacillus thuringiensis]PES78961.1 hypothetical protein CN511_25075 [Bacillus thuringiensis]PET86431.1 hypothetical protein CN529_25305 [Bacillus thuringiensis]
MSEYNNLKLVTDTVNKAFRKRKVHETVLHSDRGYQNKSKKYNQLLKKHKITVSMSRKGNCYDNACIESFFSHFKATKRYMSYYNNKRFQKRLNNLSPIEFGTNDA